MPVMGITCTPVVKVELGANTPVTDTNWLIRRPAGAMNVKVIVFPLSLVVMLLAVAAGLITAGAKSLGKPVVAAPASVMG